MTSHLLLRLIRLAISLTDEILALFVEATRGAATALQTNPKNALGPSPPADLLHDSVPPTPLLTSSPDDGMHKPLADSDVRTISVSHEALGASLLVWHPALAPIQSRLIFMCL